MTTQPLQPDPWYESLRKRLRSRWLIGLLLAGGVAGGFGIYRTVAPTQTAQDQALTVAVKQQSLPITLSANGTIKAERTINLSPKTSGYLKQLLVKEGDRVRQGQVVAYMDRSNLEGQLIQARAQLAQQEANLNKLVNGNRWQDIAQSEAQLTETQAKLQELEAGNRSEDIAQAQAQLGSAQAKLRQADDDLQRNQSLLNQGAIAQQIVNQKRSDRDAAQAAVNQAQAALTLQQKGARPEEVAQARSQVEQRQQALNSLKAGSRPEDIDAARAQVESARGALTTIQTQINDATITAPFDGVITKKYSDPGSFVTPTTASSSVEGSASNSILTLSTNNQVVAYLDEANVSRVKVGQKVSAKADSYPDRTFTGTVSQVAAQATTTQNVTSFKVKISLEPTAQALLKVGTNAEVEFQLGQLNNAILVPSAAIVRQKTGTGVYVMEDKKPVFKSIEIGTTINEQTEVKSGLTNHDRVLISFPPGTQPQSQVRSPLGDLTGGNKRNSPSGISAPPPPPP